MKSYLRNSFKVDASEPKTKYTMTSLRIILVVQKYQENISRNELLKFRVIHV